MKIFNKLFGITALALCLYIPKAFASSDVDKVAGLYLSRTTYLSSSISGTTASPNELALVFHSDGTMTRNDATAYDSWGFQGPGEGGLFFDRPINGVWEISCKEGKKIRVRAVMFQYGPDGDYPPSVTGLPGYFRGSSENATLRRCWEFEFSHVKNGKFQKCTGIRNASIAIDVAQDPLSTKIPQGKATPASSSGPLPVFARVNVEKEWFKGFPSK